MYISFTQIAAVVKMITKPAMSFLSIVFNKFHILLLFKICRESARHGVNYLFIAIINEPHEFETSMPFIVSVSYAEK